MPDEWYELVADVRGMTLRDWLVLALGLGVLFILLWFGLFWAVM
jgi:hypothetical protein